MSKRIMKPICFTLLAAALIAAFSCAAMAQTQECATKYPILLVHGLTSRDGENGNSWGRIPQALEERGAKLFFGGTDAVGSVEGNAAMLKARVNQILVETGSEKVNIVAHSKGGLEARYMISSLGMAGQVASLTTICTPHHGSQAIGPLIDKLPAWALRGVSSAVNAFYRLQGDENPDFYAAALYFVPSAMETFNEQNPDAPGVYYQSYAAAMRGPLSDPHLALPFLLIQRAEGENDGLVSVESAKWTNFQGVMRGATARGVSHADAADYHKMNFTCKESGDGIADIRLFYVDLAASLKAKGM